MSKVVMAVLALGLVVAAQQAEAAIASNGTAINGVSLAVSAEAGKTVVLSNAGMVGLELPR